MKMDGIRLVGYEAVDFPLSGVTESGPFVLKSAEGLGPPEVNVRMGRTVLEKAKYQGKSAALRQITMLVGLQPDWNNGQTPEQLRSILYPLLTPRFDILLKVQIMYQGVVQGYAEGQISRMETALFSKEPAVQIVIDCDYPYFLAPSTITTSPVRSTSDLIPGIPLQMFTVENPGTAPSGFKMGLIFSGHAGMNLVLHEEDLRGKRLQIDGLNWQAGDRLVVDTRPGSRGIWRGAAGGNLVNVLNNMNSQTSEWLMMHPGTNKILVGTLAPFSWDSQYKFTYQPAFWGV